MDPKQAAKQARQQGNKAPQNPPQSPKDEDQLAQTLGVLAPTKPEPQAPPKGDTTNEAAKEPDKTAGAGEPKGGDKSISSILELAEAAGVAVQEAVLQAMPEEVRNAFADSLRSLAEMKRQVKSSKADAWKGFDDELKEVLPGTLEALAKKHGLELKGRRIIVTFPNGSFEYINAPQTTKLPGTNGGGSHREAPVEWGKAIGPDGAEKGSPSGLATAMGLQVTGHTDMVAVFEDGGEYAVTALPKSQKSDDLIAKQKDPERAKRLTSLVKDGALFTVSKKETKG